ncbi:MAG: DNA polymerase III subunit gamma/tau [Saprospiraceae bacterium]|nr:DNA polymerase III subunit gamma/tau [Saprospiraceae bacterium]|tara:strand:+ start:936 stop:2063 length:1128 start_codon:yes stop_codon:yes gene_type:complete
MSFIVSARKYRPQKFEDVLGQEHVTATLKNALTSDKLAHAFLFCGPRGVGKTTCARILAKVINMDDPIASLKDGSYADHDLDISMNIFEQDGASNNSVENIRALIDQVRVPPQQGKYKIFIIDEVHMLSQAAFNAFLKTLEEPPPYAIFILATTEKHKILPTILSRCQIYDFKRIQPKAMVSLLKDIASKEGITADEEALFLIAEKADGAMRDALSIFDRISSASENKINYDQVVKNLNILDYDYFFRSLDLILTQDHTGLILLFDEILKKGFEGDLFVNGLAKHLRNILYFKNKSSEHILEISSSLKEKYALQSQNISLANLLTFLNLTNQTDIEYPKAKDKRLHIEINLLKMCYANTEVQELPLKKKLLTPAA